VTADTPVLVVKVGGSLVSTKMTDNDFDLTAVRHYASLIGELHRRHPGRVVFVAGGGSIGHGAVRGLDPEDVWAPWRLTEATFRVRWAWLEAFRAQGLDALSLQPSAWCSIDGNSPGHVRVSSHVLADCLDRGVLPILSGDAVLGDNAGLRVLGSDAIAMAVINAVDGPWRVLLLTNVDGYFRDTETREVVAHMYPDDAATFADSTQVDVTDTSGGMAGKLRALAELARCGAEGFILNGNSCGSLEAWAGSNVEAWPRELSFTAVSNREPGRGLPYRSLEGAAQ